MSVSAGSYSPLPSGSRFAADERYLRYQWYTLVVQSAILAVLVSSLAIGGALLGVVVWYNGDTLSSASNTLVSVDTFMSRVNDNYGALMRPFVPEDAIVRPMGEEMGVIETLRGLIMDARPMSVELRSMLHSVLRIAEKGERIMDTGEDLEKLAVAFVVQLMRSQIMPPNAAIRHTGSGPYEPAEK